MVDYVDIDQLAPIVTTHLKGAPDEAVVIYLQRACKQFCKDTSIWEESLGRKSVSEPGDPDLNIVYELPDVDGDFQLPYLSALKNVSEVKFGEDTDALIKENPNPRLARNQYRFDIVRKELTIFGGAWDTDGLLEVVAILTTSLSALEIPEFLVENWSEGIANYARWEMMNMPDREWSNSRESKTYLAKYESRVNEARFERAREGTAGAVRIDPIPFN